jgi:hypothetical protein
VDARAKSGGEPSVARDDQNQSTGATDTGEIVAEAIPLRVSVVTKHDTGKASRKTAHGGTRIVQAIRVGEQPE